MFHEATLNPIGRSGEIPARPARHDDRTDVRIFPLVGRLVRMYAELDGDHDTVERRLRDLIWLN
jgi:hypothetical protein